MTKTDQDRVDFEASEGFHPLKGPARWNEEGAPYCDPLLRDSWRVWQSALAHERARAASAPQVLRSIDKRQACRAAEIANARFGQWMPQRWLDLFIEAYGSAAPVASHEPASVSNKPDCVSSVGDTEECPTCGAVDPDNHCRMDWADMGCDHPKRLREVEEDMVGLFGAATPPEPAKAEVVETPAPSWFAAEVDRASEAHARYEATLPSSAALAAARSAAEAKMHAVNLEQCSIFVDSNPIKRAMTDAAAFIRALPGEEA